MTTDAATTPDAGAPPSADAGAAARPTHASNQAPRPQQSPRPQQPPRAQQAPRPQQAPAAPRPPSRDAAAFASLTAGLFSHLDDRQVPCKVDGCARTWTWTAAEQIESFGQPPPKRMCAEHHAAMHTVADREVKCSNPWCQRTWTWTKSAQLAQLQRPGAKPGNDEAPSRPCDHCVREERELGDAQVPCRVDGCRNTWTWSRDAQLKHRAWMRHTQASAPVAEREGERRGKRRRRGRSQGGVDGPPPRMCESCRQRLNALVDRETTCKVHGCTRTVTIDRESQLRAWVAAGSDAVAGEFALPKRMCEVCREFCRLHHDREVACGRPGCDRTWTYKTGAQLQAFLAGRFEDPLRLCAEDLASGHARIDETLEGVDVMPCIVPMCDGIWHYVPGMEIAASDDGDQPVDRMCNAHRLERGATERPLVQARAQEDAAGTDEHGNEDEGEADVPAPIPDDGDDASDDTSDDTSDTPSDTPSDSGAEPDDDTASEGPPSI